MIESKNRTGSGEQPINFLRLERIECQRCHNQSGEARDY
jgi:hypothetical protein